MIGARFSLNLLEILESDPDLDDRAHAGRPACPRFIAPGCVPTGFSRNRVSTAWANTILLDGGPPIDGSRQQKENSGEA